MAHVLRVLADAAPSGVLASSPLMCARYLEWLRDTCGQLGQLRVFGEGFWDVTSVAYCLASIARWGERARTGCMLHAACCRHLRRPASVCKSAECSM